MAFDGNLNAEWNKNILRNLIQEFPELAKEDPAQILREFAEYQICDTDETFGEFFQAAE